jgi:hypothetical protein
MKLGPRGGSGKTRLDNSGGSHIRLRVLNLATFRSVNPPPPALLLGAPLLMRQQGCEPSALANKPEKQR